MKMVELERTYLAKYLPEGLEKYPHKDMFDIYIPKQERHPNLRIRKNGDRYEITKKNVTGDDRSQMVEHTVKINSDEFKAFSEIEGKRVHKIRYLVPYGKYTAEIDVFQDELKGLVVVDFEFPTITEKEKFTMPDFCLIEVTQEEFIAGGMLCGKVYGDIEEELKQLNYTKLSNTIES